MSHDSILGRVCQSVRGSPVTPSLGEWRLDDECMYELVLSVWELRIRIVSYRIVYDANMLIQLYSASEWKFEWNVLIYIYKLIVSNVT